MAQVSLVKVRKVFSGGVEAVKGINLGIENKEFVVLVGPSGCGKSTTLRMVAGLETITDGKIYIGDKLVNDVPAKNRNIAMVFQNYALYPHMTAYENMSFSLRLRHYPKSEIDKRVKNAAQILGISRLLNRKPRMLSGGERQRVALGRAIVRKPMVFLFDEPLSNLDAKMRIQMRAEIHRLHQRLQTTMVYVTHDQVEAMTLGSRIAVMREGRVQQFADPLEVYNSPANKFVAGFIGSPPMNFINGRIMERGGNLYFNEGHFEIAIMKNMAAKLSSYKNKDVIFGIRPENVYDKLFSSFPTKSNTVKLKCEVVEPMGAANHLHLNTPDSRLVACVEANDRPNVGEYLEMVFDMKKAHFFDKDTERTIV